MPIYEYQCKKCGTEFEKLLLSASTKVECPECGSTGVEKLFSAFATHSGSSAPCDDGGCPGGATGGRCASGQCPFS